jgi:hypothetical protein
MAGTGNSVGPKKKLGPPPWERKSDGIALGGAGEAALGGAGEAALAAIAEESKEKAAKKLLATTDKGACTLHGRRPSEKRRHGLRVNAEVWNGLFSGYFAKEGESASASTSFRPTERTVACTPTTQRGEHLLSAYSPTNVHLQGERQFAPRRYLRGNAVGLRGNSKNRGSE